MTRKKKIILWLLAIPLVIIVLLLGCYGIVYLNASGRTYDNVDDVPAHEYGLLLATSPITPQGAHNFYFDNRIKATVELYRAGKIKKIIASGGNYSMDENGEFTKYGCDEPRAIRDSLMAKGIPSDAIILDYDGTRTIKSIVKAKDVYHLDSVILISQKYHNERTIWQADHYGLKAVGYNAAPSHIRRNRIKNTVREFFARVKLFIDLWFGKKPTFDCVAVEVVPGVIEDWYSYPDTIAGIAAICHRSDVDQGYGFFKMFWEKDGNPFYVNTTHGFYVELPKGLGFNQQGENMMGGHYNEFYNADTTLVVSAYGMYYDAILVDEPHYADSLYIDQKEWLGRLGTPEYVVNRNDTIVAFGKVDHNINSNPPADRYIDKWLLKKDINDRECSFDLCIFYNDSLAYREPEFWKIVNQFPDRSRE